MIGIKGNTYEIELRFNLFSDNVNDRQRKSIFLPTSINQFLRNEIIKVKRMRKEITSFSKLTINK